jgi:hypothetical protein
MKERTIGGAVDRQKKNNPNTAEEIENNNSNYGK